MTQAADCAVFLQKDRDLGSILIQSGEYTALRRIEKK
jgi:hypothetical protein